MTDKQDSIVTEEMIEAGDAALIDGDEIDFRAIYLAMDALRTTPADEVERVARALYVHFEGREPMSEPQGDWLVAARAAIAALATVSGAGDAK